MRNYSLRRPKVSADTHLCASNCVQSTTIWLRPFKTCLLASGRPSGMVTAGSFTSAPMIHCADTCRQQHYDVNPPALSIAKGTIAQNTIPLYRYRQKMKQTYSRRHSIAQNSTAWHAGRNRFCCALVSAALRRED